MRPSAAASHAPLPGGEEWYSGGPPALVRALLNTLGRPGAVVDGQGRCRACNQLWETMADGMEPGSALVGVGEVPLLESWMAPAGWRTPESAQAAQGAARGLRDVLAGQVAEFALEFSLPAAHDDRRYRLSVLPLGDPGTAALVTLEDLTPTYRIAAAARLLAEGALTLSAATDPEAGVSQVLRSALPHLGQRALLLLGSSPSELTPYVETALPEAPPAGDDVVTELCSLACVEDSIQSGRLVPHPGPGLPVGWQGLLVVPLRTQGRGLGALLLSTGENASPLNARDLDTAEELGRMLAVAIDRSQLREETQRLSTSMERRVRLRTRALEDANRELEAFAYSVSHDLRAPIRHITGFAELLERRANAPRSEPLPPDTNTAVLDDTGRRYLGIIRQAAEQARGLVEDLLTFARMGRGDLRCTRVDLAESFRMVIQELEAEYVGREVRWNLEPLPTIEADPSLLRPALRNLVSNALKFTRPRDVAEITISATELPEHPDDIVVRISDNGVGFDSRYTAKLFGVFQRLHAVDEFEGNGIGLANVRRVVERHGGQTWAEGETGRGATFYLSLPKVHGEEGSASSTRAPSSDAVKSQETGTE